MFHYNSARAAQQHQTVLQNAIYLR